MTKLNIPEKRSQGIFVRLSPKNKDYIERLAAELDTSITVIVDTIIGNARAEEEMQGENVGPKPQEQIDHK